VPLVPSLAAEVMRCTGVGPAPPRRPRLRLAACRAGVASRAAGGVRRGRRGVFLSPLIEIPQLRRRLRSELDLPGRPQVLLGLGHPQEPAPPPPRRRSVADVLTR